MNPEMSYASQGESSAPETPPQNFFNRLMGVYFSPGDTFKDVGRAPKVLIPIVALCLLTILASVIVFQKIPIEQINNQRIQQMVDDGRLTPEQGEQQKEQFRKIAPYMKVGGPLIACISVILLSLFVAGLAKLGSMMMGVENGFMALWSVAIYSMLAISIITTIIFVLLVFIKPAEDFDMNNPIGSNLAAILSALGVGGLPKFLNALLSYVDLFYIWRVILLGIGFAAVSRKLKTSTAITATAVVALIFALGASAWTAMFG